MNTALLWGGPEHGRALLVDAPATVSIVAPVRADSGPFVGVLYVRRLLVHGFAVFAVYSCGGAALTPLVEVLAMIHDKRIRPMEASHVALCK